MLRRVLKYIRDNSLLSPRGKVLVCVSGGADSVALLDVLQRGGYECVVAHCNFHLRGEESDRDQQFVGDLCAKRNLPLKWTEFDTIAQAKETAKSIEMTARNLRYAWFARVAEEEGCEAIAVAHHQNDQAETLIMNLRRGTGLKGLCGMRPKSKNPCALSEIPIIRPLLCTTHDYICHYLRDIRHLTWVEDSSNKDTAYKRNLVREELSHYQKAEIEHIAETAHLMQGYLDWIEGRETQGAKEVRKFHIREYGIIGYPLEHSFSAQYFTEKFRAEEIPATYTNYSIELPRDKARLKEILRNINGCNVTSPYKETVIGYLDQLDDIAQAIGAVNTIKNQNGKTTGYNTDWIGFQRAIQPMITRWKQSHSEPLKALIIGTGGAAKAVAYALKGWEIPYLMVSRSAKRGIQPSRLTKEIMDEYRLIVHCTPLGMYPKTEDAPDIPYQWITDQHLAFDCIYNPEETMFLSKCKQQGAQILNGKTMLVEQAEESWRIWN